MQPPGLLPGGGGAGAAPAPRLEMRVPCAARGRQPAQGAIRAVSDRDTRAGNKAFFSDQGNEVESQEMAVVLI